MTGKELVLVFAGAALLGSAAAAATQLALHDGSPREMVVDTSALEARMEQMERDQSRTAKSLERLAGTVDRVNEQLSLARSEAAERAKTGPAADAGDADGTFPAWTSDGKQRPRVQLLGGPGGAASLDALSAEQREKVLASLNKLPEMMGAQALDVTDGELPEALRNAIGTMVGADGAMPLEGMLKGMQLRRLPEAERWQKAQDELKLTGSQVEDLKSATQRLDDEMKGAMVEETRTTDGGGTLTIRRTDPEKSGAARKRYQESVDTTLDTEQRKKWRDGGYGNAFGRSGGGNMAISVMSVDSISTNGAERTGAEGRDE